MGTTSIKDGVADIQATVTSVSGGNALLVKTVGGGGIAANVNIFDSNGNNLNSVSGSLNVYDATTGTIGSTLGSLALTVGLKNAAGNLQAFQGDSSSNLLVSLAASTATVTVTGTIASTQSGSWTVSATQSGSWTVAATQSGTWTVQQGATPTSVANAWPIKVTDGTNVAAVKPANTPALSTDPALVVTISPDSVGPIFGTVTANQGSANILAAAWPIKISDGTSTVTLTGTSVNANITNTVPVSQSTTPWASNITQFGSNNVVTGTGAAGVGIPRVTVSNDSNILATQSGTWTVQQGATPTAVANAWAIKITDSTNTAAVKAASTAPVATDPALVVAISPNSTLPISSVGTAIANAPVFLSFASTNVTTSAYVQLVASTSNKMNQIFISDTSGQVMIFAVGGSGSEVNQLIVPQGGQDVWTNLTIAAGSRLSYKAQTGTASSGYLVMGFLQ